MVLEALVEALDERILEQAVQKAAARLRRQHRAAPDRRAQLERELADVEARLQRGLDALLAGTEAADELQTRLKAERGHKATLTAEIEALGRRGDAPRALDEKRLLATLRARVRAWSARPLTTATASATASRRRARLNRSCPPNSAHLAW